MGSQSSWCLLPFSPGTAGVSLGTHRCHLLRAPGRPKLWLRSLAHQPRTSLTCLAVASPNTRCLISSSGSPPPPPPSFFSPSSSPPLSPPLHVLRPHLHPDGMVIEIRGMFSGIEWQGWGRRCFQTAPLVTASSIRHLFIVHCAVGHCHRLAQGLPECHWPVGSSSYHQLGSQGGQAIAKG